MKKVKLMMGFGGIFGILIIVLIVLAVIQFSSGNNYFKIKGDPQSGNKTAMQILQGRYANGELTKEEYEQMKRDLA